MEQRAVPGGSHDPHVLGVRQPTLAVLRRPDRDVQPQAVGARALLRARRRRPHGVDYPRVVGGANEAEDQRQQATGLRRRPRGLLLWPVACGPVAYPCYAAAACGIRPCGLSTYFRLAPLSKSW